MGLKERPEEFFCKHGGQLRMSEVIKHSITRYMLYSLRDKGIIERVSRGIYRLVELPQISNPDLVTVSLRFPNAVICLVSALAWHDITTQVPHTVSVAVPRNTRMPLLDYPPVQAHKFSNEAYKSGIEDASNRRGVCQGLQSGKDPGRLLQVSQQNRNGRSAGSTEVLQDTKEIRPC